MALTADNNTAKCGNEWKEEIDIVIQNSEPVYLEWCIDKLNRTVTGYNSGEANHSSDSSEMIQ